MLGTNCVVCWEEGSTRCAVFDPGMSSQDGVNELMEFMAGNGITPDAILLTHGHFDHVWGVGALLQHFNVPVYMNADDKEILARGASLFNGMPTFKNLKVDFPKLIFRKKSPPAASRGRFSEPPAIPLVAYAIIRRKITCS